jgi:hypothetical protein
MAVAQGQFNVVWRMADHLLPKQCQSHGNGHCHTAGSTLCEHARTLTFDIGNKRLGGFRSNTVD